MTELVTSLVLCALVGQLADRALFGDPSCGWIERIGRALLFGFGIVGSLSMLVDGLGLGVSRASLGGALAVVVAGLVVPAWKRAHRPDPIEGTPASSLRGGNLRVWIVWALLLALAALGLGIAIRSGWIRPTFHFDALTRWMFKTKVLFYDQTLLGDISTDPEYAYTHQRYPPLVCHVANLPGLISGVFNDRVASAIYPWYAVSLAAVVYGYLSRRVGFLSGAFAACWIGNLPLLSFVIDTPPGAGAYGAMADIPLALFFTGTVLAVADGLERRRSRAFLEAGVVLLFATLTKNEALPFVAAVALGILVAGGRARWRPALGVAALGALGFYVLWWRIAAGFPALDENYLAQLDTEVFMARIGRLSIVLGGLAEEAVNYRSWNLTWPAVLTLVLLGGRRLLGPVPRMLVVVFLVQLASYVFAYVVTAWESPSATYYAQLGTVPDVVVYLMALTTGRLVLHIAPLAICLALVVSPLAVRRSG